MSFIFKCCRFTLSSEKLQITLQPPANVSLNEGECLTIECEAVGFPYPRFLWFRDKEQVSDGTDGQLVINNIR